MRHHWILSIDNTVIKGHAKPAGFKLGRTNMIPDGMLAFDYMIDQAKGGMWSKWGDQIQSSTAAALQSPTSQVDFRSKRRPKLAKAHFF